MANAIGLTQAPSPASNLSTPTILSATAPLPKAVAIKVAVIGAGFLLVLAGLGLVHLRRTDPAAELLPKPGARTPAPVEP